MLRGMNASDLTASQASEIYGRIRPIFGYLAALQERMEQRQFGDDDRL